MGIACETSPWCLGLGPSYWCGDMVEWSVQSLVLTPPSPHFLAGSEWGQHGQSGRQPWPESMEECGHYGTCFFCLPVLWASWCLGMATTGSGQRQQELG